MELKLKRRNYKNLTFVKRNHVIKRFHAKVEILNLISAKKRKLRTIRSYKKLQAVKVEILHTFKLSKGEKVIISYKKLQAVVENLL